jgi:SAM-dependent methyltransferase
MYFKMFGGDVVLRRVRPDATVLDIGCSDGRGSEVMAGAFGCDIYRPALEMARDSGRRVDVAQADLRHLPYRSSSFDVVVALDVVEHFDKGDALRVMAEMERVASELVVVMTPSGFVPQPPSEHEPWQLHRCGFHAHELRDLGYSVEGVGGWKAARGDYAAFRWGPIGLAVATASRLPLRQLPGQSFHLVGTKPIDG